jgi:hypothetical protein
MIEIYRNIFVGDQNDFENGVALEKEDWAVVQACKEPYHRNALGYSGRAASKEHPEYLIALRENRLILNLVDVDNPDWISPKIINRAIEFIDESVESGKQVLVHCNQGVSRSAVIGQLYLAHLGKFSECSFEGAERQYSSIYPSYNPANGMREYARINWEKYRQR